MNNDEKLEIWKRKLIELGGKAKKLNNDKIILIGILNELNKRSNIKLNNALYNVDLPEEISYLDDWVEFYKEKNARYKSKISIFEKDVPQQELQKIKEDVKGEEKQFAREKLKELIKLSKNKTIILGIFILLSLLMIIILFLLKPSITGYTILTKQTDYTEDLNLRINESGNYTWTLDKQGNIKSIKVKGSVSGNGTARVYIEKNGKRYLIYKNK